MKKISLFPSILASTFFAMVLMSCTLNAQLPDFLTNGLVGEWHFSGSGDDASGRGNNVIINGATLFTDRFGNPNSALAITSNYGGAVTLSNINISGNETRTISYWTKFATLGSSWPNYTQSYIAWGDDSTVGSRFLWSQESKGNLWFNGNYADIYISPPNNLPNYNVWRLVTLTYNGTLGSAIVYVNGVVQTNRELGVYNAVDWSGTLNTVDTPVSMSGLAGDFIDDVTIYNRALSSTEVKQLHLAQVGSLDSDEDGSNDYREIADGTDPNDAASFNPLSKGLVAYYPFSGNAKDESGTGKDGVSTAITYDTDYFGKSASSAAFTNGSAIDIPDLTGLQFRPITYSLWVYLSNIQSNAQTTLIGRKQTWNQEDGGVVVDTRFGSNNELMYHTGATAITSGLTLSLGQWYQIVFTQDTNSQASFYVNGQLLVSQLFTAPQTATSFPFRLGAESALVGISTGEGILNGKMDNVRVYGRALSEADVRALYYSEAFRPEQKLFLSNAPEVMGHYSQTEYDDFGTLQLSNGVSSVLTNPSAFNLFTPEEFDAHYNTGLSDGVSVVISNPSSYGLYTSDSIMDLRMGGLMIQKIGTNAVVSFQPQTTTDLTLPFTNNGTPVTNTIPMPGNKGFIRINAKP